MGDLPRERGTWGHLKMRHATAFLDHPPEQLPDMLRDHASDIVCGCKLRGPRICCPGLRDCSHRFADSGAAVHYLPHQLLHAPSDDFPVIRFFYKPPRV